MKKTVKKMLAVLLASSMLFALAACSKSEETTNEGKKEETKTSTESTASTEKTVAENKEVTDQWADFEPLKAYETPINLTAWRFIHTGAEFMEGEDINNNVWTNAYLSEMGIDLDYVWTVPEEQFTEKLNISIASGDLPDLMWVDRKSLVELAENDKLYDLTELFDRFCEEELKETLQADQKSFDTAKVDGKLYSIPYTKSSVDNLHMLWIRTDWLDNLGLELPKTMQDVIDIAYAFTNNDPDGNGIKDTYGLGLCKTFETEGHYNINGFLAGYHGYLRKWLPASDGTIQYTSIQPEVKEGLLALQKMYADGVIDPEFGVKARADVKEDTAAGKIGMEFGSMSGALSVLQVSVDNDPNAEWMPMEIPSIDSNPATPITEMPVKLYFCVNKECKNPEALIKMMNIGGKLNEEQQSVYGNVIVTEGDTSKNYGVWQYAYTMNEAPRKNLDAHNHVLEALASGNPSELNQEELSYYDNIVKYRAGDKSFWGTERVFGTPSSQDVLQKYVDKDSYLFSAFYGGTTEGMNDYLATLNDMEEEVFTKIIMGTDVSAFDEFVNNWKSLGGDTITDEVNEWYKENNK